MFLRAGDTEKQALPEFTVENMGVSEKVIVLQDSEEEAEGEVTSEKDSEEEAEGEVTSENATAAASDGDNPVEPRSLEAGSLGAHRMDEITNGSSLMSQNAVAISTTPLQRFKDLQRVKDTLQQGDHVSVFGFNNDDRWVTGAVIVSEGELLDTWKIQFGNVTRDIGKVSVVRAPVVPVVEKLKKSKKKTDTPGCKKLTTTTMATSASEEQPTTKQTIAGMALSNELVTTAPHQHISSDCIDCLSSTWACLYNSVNIQTATLLQQVGLTGHITKADGNLCLYRAFHELLPNNIPSIDHDLEGAKKILFEIVQNH